VASGGVPLEELAKDRKSSRGVFINNTELLKMVKNCLYSKDNPNFPINEGEEPNPEMVISYLNDKVSKVQEELKKAIKENDIENQEVLNDELRHYRRYVEDMER
jgi:vacuolar-type H+-ATPase subunit I/STV1